MSNTWLITGISSGLGRGLAEHVLESGGRVFGTVRNDDGMEELAARYGGRLVVRRVDVTDDACVRAFVDDAFAEAGRIDVVVSNAGYGLFGVAEALTLEQIRHQLATNLVGSIETIRAALPHLRTQGGGRILQISSEGGQITYPNFSAYHASKWGIEGFVEAVAQEVAPFGIAFTIVEPGATRTKFGAGLVRAPELAAYDATPAGDLRRAMAAGTGFRYSDPAKTVRAIAASVERDPAPRRLVLGSGSYERIRAALADRMAELDAQEAIARGTDE